MYSRTKKVPRTRCIQEVEYNRELLQGMRKPQNQTHASKTKQECCLHGREVFNRCYQDSALYEGLLPVPVQGSRTGCVFSATSDKHMLAPSPFVSVFAHIFLHFAPIFFGGGGSSKFRKIE